MIPYLKRRRKKRIEAFPTKHFAALELSTRAKQITIIQLPNKSINPFHEISFPPAKPTPPRLISPILHIPHLFVRPFPPHQPQPAPTSPIPSTKQRKISDCTQHRSPNATTLALPPHSSQRCQLPDRPHSRRTRCRTAVQKLDWACHTAVSIDFRVFLLHGECAVSLVVVG